MDTMQTIIQRQSCRLYKKGVQVSQEQLDTILGAANASPIGRRKYENVKLTVIQNPELLEEIDRKGAATMGDPSGHPTYLAPTLIMVSVIEPEDKFYPVPFCNAACVIENMHLAATEVGLGSVYLMSLIKAANAGDMRKKLGISEGFMAAGFLAVGIPAFPPKERTMPVDRILTEYIM